jgi:hypothetical protein
MGNNKMKMRLKPLVSTERERVSVISKLRHFLSCVIGNFKIMNMHGQISIC